MAAPLLALLASAAFARPALALPPPPQPAAVESPLAPSASSSARGPLPGTGRQMDYPSALSAPPEGPPRRLLSELTSGPDGPAVSSCLRKCMPGCVRGGAGAPGLGPATLRKDPVVFTEGFRDRGTCLRECTEVCALKVSGAKK